MTQINKLVAFVALIFIIFMSVFTVSETQKAAKFAVGKMVKFDYKPGLYFKVPFYNTVEFFDSRIVTMDSKPERFLTSEKKNVIVDSFVKWKLDDVETFYTNVRVAEGATEEKRIDKANTLLDPIIKNAFRSEFSQRTIRQLVATERSIIREALLNNTSEAAAQELGIRIIDVQVKRIDLPPDVSNSVYSRMEAERARVASEFRSQGVEASERIRADADKQRQVILANAFKDSEILRGKGDAESAEIYAKSYNQDVEFYSFYRSMQAYRNTFRGSGDMIVLEPDSDYFKYFKQSE